MIVNAATPYEPIRASKIQLMNKITSPIDVSLINSETPFQQACPTSFHAPIARVKRHFASGVKKCRHKTPVVMV